MSKKKRGKGPTTVVLPDSVSAGEMKYIIADGLTEFEERKKRQEEADKELRQKEWQQIIGIKDFSDAQRPKRWLLECCNFFEVVWKVSTISGKQIKGEGISFGIMQILLAAFFSLLNGILLMFAVTLFATGAVFLFSGIFLLCLEAWIFGFFAFLFSRLFRIASFEIMNTKNHSYLFGLFACVTSIASIAIAIVALFVTQR